MDPKKPNKELFHIFIDDYLNKSGLSKSAEIFRNEAQITTSIPPQFDQRPRGILHNFWNYRESSKRKMPGSSSQSQAANVGAIMDTTPAIQSYIEGYSIEHISCFPSSQTLCPCDFSSDGKIVASGGDRNPSEPSKPFICYIKNGHSVTTSKAHVDDISEVRFKPGSTKFATSSTDGTVKLWDAERPARLLSSFGNHNELDFHPSLDFHPTEEVICSSHCNDVINVWDLNQNVVIFKLEVEEGGSKVRFQPKSGKLLAVAKGNVITIFDYPSFGVKYHLQGHDENICSLCWDVTGQMIASVSEDSVRVWSLSLDGKCIYEYPSKRKRLKSIIFHPRHRNVLVVGGLQGMELLMLENGKIHCSAFASGLSFTGLAACTLNGSIASTSGEYYRSAVNIWK